MARLIPLGEPVTRGEQIMLEYLQKHLPNDWVIFGNALVATGRMSRELDAIVVGDRCVWVIDEKGFGGRITGDEYTWILADGSARDRVLDNILHAAKIVKGKLEAADSRLSNAWVEGIVLLSATDVEIQVRDERVTSSVHRLGACEDYFLAANIPRARRFLPAEKATIERAISGAFVVDRLHKRFSRIGPYTVIELGQSGDGVQSFRAERNKTRELVELKVYDLSALPDQETRAETRRRAEREFEALRKLRDTQGVIRVADSFQPVPGYGADLYYFALDLPSGPCLASRLAELSWVLESRFAAGKRLSEIVRSVHESGVIHRNLSPACIYFSNSDCDFQLTGFEFSRLPISTVHIPANEFQMGPYTAPEVRDSTHNATKASDVFSLGVILFEMLSGHKPFGNRTRELADPSPTLNLAQNLLPANKQGDLEALLQLMLSYDPKGRPQDISDVLDVLEDLARSTGSTLESCAASVHPVPPGAQLGEFTVLSYLGAGGCFYAYKVANRVDDSQEYVAKVVRYPELLDIARREFNALSTLDHPNIVRVYDVRARIDAPYQLLELYAPGQTARDLMLGSNLSPQQVAKWASSLTDALVYMEAHTPSIYHGDVSPRNIILDGNNVPRLIDFGLAHLNGKGVGNGVVGTAPYRPPERDVAGADWPTSGDVYSLGVVICEMLFGELPYDCECGQLNKQHLHKDLFESTSYASADFLSVLRRAVDPSASKRFANATEFQRALAIVPELKGMEESPRQERSVNPYLNQVLKVYSHGECNAENRGMDSAFARATYVPTELDRELLPSIRDRKYALVVLAGNPGDGKTAFLQQVALHLGFQGDSLPLNHWEIVSDGWTYECVLDGSAADSDREMSSDDVLDALFAPIEDQGDMRDIAESLQRTQMLAINDGRLIEYLYDRLDEGSSLVHQLLRCLGEENGDIHPQIVLVDLNHRSLAIGGEDDAFGTVLSALLLGGREEDRQINNPWEMCRHCRASSSCHVRFNVETLLHPMLGEQVRSRLRTLLMLIHGRGRLHVTMRELRSTLSLLIFGNQTCEQIHNELEMCTQEDEIDGRDKLAKIRRLQRKRLYFNRLFESGEASGRLFEQLSDFDPARVNNPRFDRMVASALRSTDRIQPLLTFAEARLPHAALAFDGENMKQWTEEAHETLRRMLFFEGQSENWRIAAEKDFWVEMMPFRSAKRWVESLNSFRQGKGNLPDELCHLICLAISRTENVPDELLDRFLAVRTASSLKTDLVVVRLFDLVDFKLRWERPQQRSMVLGELPMVMLLEYGAGRDPCLEISADLFELLERFAEGYRLGSEELEGVAAHLQLFKNRLLAMPAREVSLLHPSLGRFQARQDLALGRRRIVLEELS